MGRNWEHSSTIHNGGGRGREGVEGRRERGTANRLRRKRKWGFDEGRSRTSLAELFPSVEQQASTLTKTSTATLCLILDFAQSLDCPLSFQQSSLFSSFSSRRRLYMRPPDVPTRLLQAYEAICPPCIDELAATPASPSSLTSLLRPLPSPSPSPFSSVLSALCSLASLAIYGREWPVIVDLICCGVLSLGTPSVKDFSSSLAVRSLFGALLSLPPAIVSDNLARSRHCDGWDLGRSGRACSGYFSLPSFSPTGSADSRPRILREHAGGGSWALLGYPAARVRLFFRASRRLRRFSSCSKPPRRFCCCSKPPTNSSPLNSYAVGYLLSCVVNLTAVADHSDWRSSSFSFLPSFSTDLWTTQASSSGSVPPLPSLPP
jgi:hypothetical protein